MFNKWNYQEIQQIKEKKKERKIRNKSKEKRNKVKKYRGKKERKRKEKRGKGVGQNILISTFLQINQLGITLFFNFSPIEESLIKSSELLFDEIYKVY